VISTAIGWRHLPMGGLVPLHAFALYMAAWEKLLPVERTKEKEGGRE